MAVAKCASLDYDVEGEPYSQTAHGWFDQTHRLLVKHWADRWQAITGFGYVWRVPDLLTIERLRKGSNGDLSAAMATLDFFLARAEWAGQSLCAFARQMRIAP